MDIAGFHMRGDGRLVLREGEGKRVANKVGRATAKARGTGDEAEHGKRLIQLELLRRRE